MYEKENFVSALLFVFYYSFSFLDLVHIFHKHEDANLPSGKSKIVLSKDKVEYLSQNVLILFVLLCFWLLSFHAWTTY